MTPALAAGVFLFLSCDNANIDSGQKKNDMHFYTHEVW